MCKCFAAHFANLKRDSKGNCLFSKLNRFWCWRAVAGELARVCGREGITVEVYNEVNQILMGVGKQGRALESGK